MMSKSYYGDLSGASSSDDYSYDYDTDDDDARRSCSYLKDDFKDHDDNIVCFLILVKVLYCMILLQCKSDNDGKTVTSSGSCQPVLMMAESRPSAALVRSADCTSRVATARTMPRPCHTIEKFADSLAE